jgi:hypothetical protein
VAIVVSPLFVTPSYSTSGGTVRSSYIRTQCRTFVTHRTHSGDTAGSTAAGGSFGRRAPTGLLHPSIADLYQSKVEDLAAALRREDTRLEASEMLRGLIEAIVLTPEDGPAKAGPHDSKPGEPRLRIELRGNLAAMLTAAQPPSRVLGGEVRATASLAVAFGGGGKTKRSPETGDLHVPINLVAGARNPLDLEFCWTAA